MYQAADTSDYLSFAVVFFVILALTGLPALWRWYRGPRPSAEVEAAKESERERFPSTAAEVAKVQGALAYFAQAIGGAAVFASEQRARRKLREGETRGHSATTLDFTIRMCARANIAKGVKVGTMLRAGSSEHTQCLLMEAILKQGLEEVEGGPISYVSEKGGEDE